jgi:hypothetical protein
MDEVDLGRDAELQEVLERLVGVAPIPSAAGGLNTVPRNAISGAAHAKHAHQVEVLPPAAVMVGQLVFVEGAASDRMRRGDERVFDASRPPERVGLRQSSQSRAGGQSGHPDES